MTVTGLGYAEAAELIGRAGGSVKTALVMHGMGVGRGEALERLEKAGGFVRRALEEAR